MGKNYFKNSNYDFEYVVGVTGTGSLIGQAIIKSIKDSELHSKIRIIGFDYFQHTVGSYWCDQNYILPDIINPNVTEEQWVNSITEFINKESISIIFIGIDFELPIFSRVKNNIKNSTGCDIIVADQETINIGNDKFKTYEFLKKHSFFFPETILPENFKPSKIKFPFIIKPRIGARSRGVFLVKSLDEYWEKLSAIDKPIIQEYIGNEDSEYTCGVLKIQGEIKGAIALKRVLKDGNTFKAEFSLKFPQEIYNYIIAVAEKLDFVGSCNFQLRLDNKGVPKIFEINPRHSGTTYIRALFGFNEVESIIRYYFKLPQKKFEFKEGKVIRHFDEMLVE